MRVSMLLTVIAIAGGLALSAQTPQRGSSNESSDRIFIDRLKAIASSAGGHPTDCGKTDAREPKESVAVCGEITSSQNKPFFLAYESRFRDAFQLGYGLAEDAAGNFFSVSYDERGYLPVALTRHMRLADN